MRLALYGSKEFAATLAELAMDCGHEIEGMIDDYDSGPGVLGSFEDMRVTMDPKTVGFVIAIGYRDLSARWRAMRRVVSHGFKIPTLIHPNSYVAKSAVIQSGAILMAGSIVDVRATIGEGSVLWPGCCVNHDAAVGANVFISPGAIVCGHATIGVNSFLGAGSVVVDHCKLPANTFAKALSRITSK